MYMLILLLLIIIFIMAMNFRDFLQQRYRINVSRNISIYGLISLALLYLTIALGFSGIYLVLELTGINVIYIKTDLLNNNAMEYLLNIIYFSSTTLFSIGYGDIVPVGLGKVIAIMEGLIGYLLPPAFIVTYLMPTSK